MTLSKAAQAERAKRGPRERSDATKAEQTAQAKEAYLAAYRQTGIIVSACEVSGVGRSTMYDWQEHDPAFTAACQVALAASTEMMEREALRRAVEGTERPIVRDGRVVGTVRDYSDNLLMFMLKGRSPDRYRDNAKIEHVGAVDFGTIGELLQGHDARSR